MFGPIVRQDMNGLEAWTLIYRGLDQMWWEVPKGRQQVAKQKGEIKTLSNG